MASMKSIKRRISSVKSTKHTMKAMDLVATSKLQKAKTQLDVIRPLFNNIKPVMDHIQSGATESIYIETREVKNIAYLVITSDRGLCGGYNANVLKEALSFINSNVSKQEKIITIGMKGYEFFRRQKKNIIQRYPGTTEISYNDAENIIRYLISLYTSGEVDEVYIAYTRFHSIMSHSPKVIRILPIGDTDDDTQPDTHHDHSMMTYEPDVTTFLEYAVPMYLNTLVYGAMAESVVCELASRMTSMNAATRNATEIIDDLTLAFNRIRQANITQEITEIVSGANVLQ